MSEFNLTIKDSSIAFVASFLLCQLAVIIFTILGMYTATFFGATTSGYQSFMSTAEGLLISSLVMDGTMLGIFFFFNKKSTSKIINKPNIKKTFLYISIAIASFIMLYPIITCIDNLLIYHGVKISELSYDLSTKNYFISLISLVVLPAVCEELLFRGIIFRGLKQGGKTFSIIITGIMFSIFHMSITQSVYPLLMGILLSLVMYQEDNIYYPILIHIINNFLSLTLSYFGISLVFNHWTYILLACVLAIVFITLVLTLSIIGNRGSKKTKISTEQIIYLISSFAIMLLIWISYNITTLF